MSTTTLQWLELNLGFAHGRCMISSVTACSGKQKEVDMCEASIWTFDHHAPEASAMIRFVSGASIAYAKPKRHQISKHMKASGLIPLAAAFLLPLKNQPLFRCLCRPEFSSNSLCHLYSVSLGSLPQPCDTKRPWNRSVLARQCGHTVCTEKSSQARRVIVRLAILWRRTGSISILGSCRSNRQIRAPIGELEGGTLYPV